MSTKISNPTSVSASYVVNPVNGEISLVVTTRTKAETKLRPKPKFVKTHYSIDTNGGGYMGL